MKHYLNVGRQGGPFINDDNLQHLTQICLKYIGVEHRHYIVIENSLTTCMLLLLTLLTFPKNNYTQSEGRRG